jgi:ribonuclease HII
VIRPNLRLEKSLLREGHTVVVGCDEVGRGALSGPVSVGVLALDASMRRVPPGLADSKLLSPERRTNLVPRVQRWALDFAVGHAAAVEIDQFGIITALRLAGLRALTQLTVAPDVVVLDGNLDWLSARASQGDLFADEPPWPTVAIPTVVTRVKADMHCGTVAGASVLAKTTRDAMMVELAAQHPEFGWDENKGYASPEHLAELEQHGPCPQHRRSWRIPGGQNVSREEFA